MTRSVRHPETGALHFHLTDHPVCRALIQAIDRPLLGLPLLPTVAVEAVYHDPYAHHVQWGEHVGVTLHAGDMAAEHPTLLDLTTGDPKVVRQGKGDTSFLS